MAGGVAAEGQIAGVAVARVLADKASAELAECKDDAHPAKAKAHTSANRSNRIKTTPALFCERYHYLLAVTENKIKRHRNRSCGTVRPKVAVVLRSGHGHKQGMFEPYSATAVGTLVFAHLIATAGAAKAAL
jgi:hypothetical protein